MALWEIFVVAGLVFVILEMLVPSMFFLNLAVADGSIAYRTLGAIVGEQVITTITLDDGSHPPFGAIVYRQGDIERDVAMVADQGLTYLTGVSSSASFVIKWNSSQSCQLVIPSVAPDKLKNLTCKMD